MLEVNTFFQIQKFLQQVTPMNIRDYFEKIKIKELIIFRYTKYFVIKYLEIYKMTHEYTIYKYIGILFSHSHTHVSKNIY